jgi:hypothetical protein
MAELGLGMQTVLLGGLSPDHPISFAETSEGKLLLANGIDPMLEWDGQKSVAEPCGVIPPTQAVSMSGVGPGSILGKFFAFQRYIDDEGNPSNLSPIGIAFNSGYDSLIDNVDFVPNTGVVTITSLNHGLTGTQPVTISGVRGVNVNGNFTVRVVDEDTFVVQGLVVTGGFYEGGGSWQTGSAVITYTGVQQPNDFTIVRRQVLRNLSGNMESLYVDVDTTDLTSTTFLSAGTDEQLIGGIAVPLYYGEDDLPYANRYGVPPNHKSVLCSHKGRVYAGCDSIYDIGHVEPQFNSNKFQGVGTEWRNTFIGRMLYVDGAKNPYEITSVDVVNQVITTSSPYLDSQVPYALYLIRPAVAEHRLIYYSEAGLSEAWPPYNALAIPETNDEIVGLLSLGQYLYVAERRHLHRVTFQGDPSDGSIFLAATRGSINNRTYIVVDNDVYFMDEIGIYKFDGQEVKSVSLQIQNLFQNDGTSIINIDWNADQTLWHAAHDPARDTIRWFVSIVGYEGLFNAICYNYRTDHFWFEEYSVSINSSTNATIGCRRSLVGTDARRVLCLSQGFYDGIDGTGTTRGTATSSTSTTITDSAATFEAVEGAPVTIVEGGGAGQTSIIATVTDTQLEVLRPFAIPLDSSSVYQIGGIPWSWRSGWFRYYHHEEEASRDVEIIFRPTATKSTLNIQLFYDHDPAPRVWGVSDQKDGIRTLSGDSNIYVDLAVNRGWARQRMKGHSGEYAYGHTYVSVEMSGVQSGSPVIVSQLILNDVDQEG